MELISQREFSRRIGVSEGSVRKAIEALYIVNGRVTRDNGTPAIDYETALAEWNASPAGLKSADKTPQIRIKTPVAGKNSAESGQKEADTQVKNPVFNPELMAEKQNMMARRSKSMEISTARAALALQKEQQKVVDKDKSYAAFFEFGKGLRENLLTLPTRLTALMRAAATDHEAAAIMSRGIEDILQSCTAPPDLTI